jgi:hypothetical protein
VPERLVRHHRPEVGSADPDVHHVADALPGVPRPCAAPHPLGEVGHLVEHGVDAGHHVLAVDDDGLVARGTQGDVQHGSPLGDVDPLTAEHGIDARAQAGFLREPDEQTQRLVGDAVLRVVQVDARREGRQPVPARRVVGEQLPQVEPLHLPMMGLQGGPRRATAERSDRHGGVLMGWHAVLEGLFVGARRRVKGRGSAPRTVGGGGTRGDGRADAQAKHMSSE